MKGTGTIGFGSVVAGGIEAKVKMEDGTNWKFTGGLLGLEVGVGGGAADFEFPGYSHLAGPCSVGVIALALGSGKAQVRWANLKGDIGVADTTTGGGLNITIAGGFGDWAKV